jgi:hypothetical protein
VKSVAGHVRGAISNIAVTMLWPADKRVRHLAIPVRMADGSEGRRMRRTKGALHAHDSMRSEGRTPGDEGRAVIEANREVRKRDAEHGYSRLAKVLAPAPSWGAPLLDPRRTDASRAEDE